MEPDFHENLLDALRKSMQAYSERILSGSFSTFEEYKSCAGRLHGLKEAEHIIQKTYKDMYEIIPKSYLARN